MDDIHRELKERSRILAIYNERREDFPSKEAWDDYLEMLEDTIYNIVNKIDVPATEAKIGEYQRSNRIKIIANQARSADEQKQILLVAAEASTQAQASSAVGDEKPVFSFKPQILVAAQPVPVVPPHLDEEGRLPAPRGSRGAQLEAMALASGWSPDLPKSRAVQEAFASVLAF